MPKHPHDHEAMADVVVGSAIDLVMPILAVEGVNQPVAGYKQVALAQ